MTPDIADSLQMLGLSFVLSAVIGAEREYHHKDAGLRTHILVGLGSALFTVVSAYGFAELIGDRPADPGRIAAQVVTGIGFLGAGVIFTRSNVVHGLTTAATIWLVAAVGMACGAQLPLVATAVTLGYLVLIPLLGTLTARMPKAHADSVLALRYRDGQGVLRSILSTATDLGFRAAVLDVTETAEHTVEVRARFTGKPDQHELITTLSALDGVERVAAVGEG
nr:MgtC/SapB family protein [Georgenia sp. H159]